MQLRESRWQVVAFVAIMSASIAFSFYFSDWHHRWMKRDTYALHAQFQNVGHLRIGAVVKLAGVTVGRVTKIGLNQDYQAVVTFQVMHHVQIPDDSQIGVVTRGVLGGNYLEITPGFDDVYLKANQRIVHAQSAFVLENLITKIVAAVSHGGQ